MTNFTCRPKQRVTREELIAALRIGGWAEASKGIVFRRGDDTAFVYEDFMMFAADHGEPLGGVGWKRFDQAIALVCQN